MSPAARWIGVVVALLAMSVVTQAILIVAAINDPSFAVEPGWDEKAAGWDEAKRIEAESARLGWTAEITTSPTTRRREARVALELYDRWGKPVPNAEVELETFHNARAARRLTGALTHLDEASYVAVLPIDRPGIWEFRVVARRGDELFTETIRKSVPVSSVTGGGAESR